MTPDEARQPPRPRPGDDAVTWLLPYRNVWALAAWYVGIVSLVPLPLIGTLLGVAAIILGIAGMVRARSTPEARGRVHAVLGIVLGLVSLFVCTPVTLVLVYVGFFL